MGAFRFRAQAAIDLRRREHDETRRQMARTAADLRAAERSCDEAEQRAADGRTRWAAAVHQALPIAEQQWHRSWIVRLDRERAAAQQTVAARQACHMQASLAQVRAKQRLQSLERFKEKAQRAWDEHAAKEEQKELDALASMRFAATVSRMKLAAGHPPER